MMALFAGPLAKVAGIAAAAAAILIAGLLWLRTHDAAIRTQDAAAVTRATAAAQARDNINAIRVLENSNADQRAADALLALRKEKISHAQDADQLVTDRAVLDALRLLGPSPGTGDGAAERPTITP